MGVIEDRLAEMELELPAPLEAPAGVRLPYDAARATGLSMLSSLKHELGDLDEVKVWIKVLGFVKCAEGFNVTPAAINGFSDLILTLWGEAGHHAWSAIGADELPMGMPVEVEALDRMSGTQTVKGVVRTRSDRSVQRRRP